MAEILVKYNSKTLISVFRFIYAKMQYATGTLEKRDVFLVNHIFLALIDLAESDHNFLISKIDLLHEIRDATLLMNKEFETNWHKQLPTKECHFPKKAPNLLLSPRAFTGLLNDKEFKKKYLRAVREEYICHKKFHARYIGVGYKDKGTCRKIHLDGNPTWQEIASLNLALEKNIFKVEKPLAMLMLRDLTKKGNKDEIILENQKNVLEFCSQLSKKMAFEESPEIVQRQRDRSQSFRAILARNSAQIGLTAESSSYDV